MNYRNAWEELKKDIKSKKRKLKADYNYAPNVISREICIFDNILENIKQIESR